MLSMATFYRRSESLFEGILITRLTLNSAINPAGLIRTSGKDRLRVKGTAGGIAKTEEVQNRLSTYSFSLVEYIEPVSSSFTGKVFASDPGGVAIPINSILFALPVEMAFPYLTTNSPIRTQEEIGATPIDKIINVVVKYSIASTLKINDYMIIQGKQYTIKNSHSIDISHWLLQTILEEP